MNDLQHPELKSLDDLLEVLCEDGLRNIAGGSAVRPKGMTPE